MSIIIMKKTSMNVKFKKTELEHPEVRIESMNAIVFSAKSRWTVELSLISAFAVIISKHRSRNPVREKQVASKHKLLI